MRILYIGDLHLGSGMPEREREISEQLIKRAEQADLVLSVKGGYGVIRELMAILQASQPMGTGHAG